jgi:hypothetical protein
LGGIKRMDMTICQKERPRMVTLGLALFAANQVPNLVLDLIRGNWHNPYFYIIFLILLAVLFIPVWFTFHGYNWARWLLIAIFWVGFSAHLLSLINSGSWLALDFLKPFVDVVALVALFLPSSNRWFRRCKT